MLLQEQNYISNKHVCTVTVVRNMQTIIQFPQIYMYLVLVSATWVAGFN